MKTLCIICSLLVSIIAHAQDEYNFDFDKNPDQFQFDNTSNNSLWQIGIPQKAFFNEAYSAPNAILTDTLNNYPPNQNTSFTFEFYPFQFPYIQVEWRQKTDFEKGVDGGVVEASYDGGDTWLNVLNDTIFRPVVVGNYQVDTLFNGDAGFSGTDDWEWVAICWGTYYGEIPTNTQKPVYVKFTVVSDSVDTQQEGWMLDNFRVIQGAIGSVNSLSFQPIDVYPNPVQQNLFINLPMGQMRNANITIYNNYGQAVYNQSLNAAFLQTYSLSTQNLPNGIYTFMLITENAQFRNRFIKVE